MYEIRSSKKFRYKSDYSTANEPKTDENIWKTRLWRTSEMAQLFFLSNLFETPAKFISIMFEIRESIPQWLRFFFLVGQKIGRSSQD